MEKSKLHKLAILGAAAAAKEAQSLGLSTLVEVNRACQSDYFNDTPSHIAFAKAVQVEVEKPILAHISELERWRDEQMALVNKALSETQDSANHPQPWSPAVGDVVQLKSGVQR